MNTPNDTGRVMVLGKVGRGRAVFVKRIIAEQGERLPVIDLDALLAAGRLRRPIQSHIRLRDLVDPDHLWKTRAELIMGNPQGDSELRRRMMYLRAAEEGTRLIELVRRDSRLAGRRDGLKLTASKSFALDPSRLSCSLIKAEI